VADGGGRARSRGLRGPGPGETRRMTLRPVLIWDPGLRRRPAPAGRGRIRPAPTRAPPGSAGQAALVTLGPDSLPASRCLQRSRRPSPRPARCPPPDRSACGGPPHRPAARRFLADLRVQVVEPVLKTDGGSLERPDCSRPACPAVLGPRLALSSELSAPRTPIRALRPEEPFLPDFVAWDLVAVFDARRAGSPTRRSPPTTTVPWCGPSRGSGRRWPKGGHDDRGPRRKVRLRAVCGTGWGPTRWSSTAVTA
jgi:hypothetical protein